MDRKTEIRNVLRSLGITPDKKGYSYTIYGVEIVLDEFAQGYGFKQRFGVCDLYTLISETDDSKPSNVERAIRYVIEMAHKKGTNKMRELFPDTDKKPCAARFIATLAEHIAFDRGGISK